MKKQSKPAKRFTANSLWRAAQGTLTAHAHLDHVLGSVINLPMAYWRPRFLFAGASDERLSELSQGRFPRTLMPSKTHPVFASKPLPDGVGFQVIPCSTKRPRGKIEFRCIRLGCRLRHTGQRMDRNSFLIDAVRLNLPASIGGRLRFRGEVPEKCIAIIGRLTDGQP